MVLRRLAGVSANTAPVLTLITQFGGGKTHTLTALYHLATSGEKAVDYPGVADLLREAGLRSVPQARVAVFVGNAWDPQDGKETPWIDIARQLAGDAGVEALGKAAETTPPGTESLTRVVAAANAPVLILFDEVLNFLSRHRGMAESFHSFIQNLTVAMTGIAHGAVLISLPRSQVEMTDWDLQWQEKITKVVRRVSKDLIVNDEAEIAEVVRRRLFEDLGNERVRKNVAKVYADWCFERRAQLPPEWTAVDTAATEAKARDYLRSRFEACYPFHPATLSVFQRKWQTLQQYQQTRGTLAMLAQWVAWAYRTGFTEARKEPLITLGSAPLHDMGFRSTVLGQLGESRLVAAIDADIAGEQSHARALDADTKGPLRNIHYRVGTAILFESSGGQADKVAHLPELRFALGEPEVDTTSVDNAAFALEAKAYYIERVGSDGFKVRYRPRLNKTVNDRRASLDYDTEIRPAMRKIVEDEFRRGASISILPFPQDGEDVPDTPKLTLVVGDPETEWTADTRSRIAEWTTHRGKSPRLYPGALVWCIKKPGRELREKVELWLAWKRVEREVAEGTLGADLDRSERAEIQVKVKDAQEAAKDEVWGGYRFVVIYEPSSLPPSPTGRRAGGEGDELKSIDLGAGHSSGSETLCGRVIAALKSAGLLSESLGAGYIERNWPPALKESGEWPLISLRQSFLNGSLTRLLDPDTILRNKILEFASRGDFGLASGRRPEGTYERVWFKEPPPLDEVAFESGVFLLAKAKAQALKEGVVEPRTPGEPSVTLPSPEVTTTSEEVGPASGATVGTRTLRLRGSIPPESWNRLGTKILPKLRSGTDLTVGLDLSVTINADAARGLISDLRQILADLGLADQIWVEDN
ncbi:MAG: DUF499 domain-containing protein [Coriobacteriia bacterium]|nr:DUF499 domain-containing protein [Coriobacteriia bacterium]